MFFQTRQSQVEKQVYEYCDAAASCIQEARHAIEEYCRAGDRVQLRANVKTVHSWESRADDIRRDVEVMMYTKAMFPESRGDILGLLEAVDRVPNQSESVIRMLWMQHIRVPEEFTPALVELVSASQRCADALLQGVRQLFHNFTEATVAVGKVDQMETEVDQQEETLIERIFAAEGDLAEKLLLRDVVIKAASVSDRAEAAGDRIRIIVAKRKV